MRRERGESRPKAQVPAARPASFIVTHLAHARTVLRSLVRRRRPLVGATRALALAAALSACGKRPPVERVFVSNEDSGDISVIDVATDTVSARIPVGKRPRGLRVSPDGTHLYVALSGSQKSGPPSTERALGERGDRAADGIGVVSLPRARLEGKLSSGQDPEAFDVAPDGRLLVVSNEETGEASLVDVRGARVRTVIPVGREPEGVAVRPDGKAAYVTSEADDEVTVIDTSRFAVIARIPVGARPRGLAFAPDGRRAYVTNELGGSVTVIDTERNVPVDTIELRGPSDEARPRPMGIAVAPDGKRLYVTTGRGGGVAVVDTSTGRVLSTITGVGPRPWGIAVTRDGRKLYVANGPSNDVSVIDTRSARITARLKVGASPWGVATGAS
jgi:YVTN family beta-propeller protein